MVKKLIVIAIIFALFLAGAIWEISYTTHTYARLYDRLTLLSENFDLEEDVKNERSISLMDEAFDIWKSNKEALFCLGNHNVLRTVDDKMVSLKAMVDTNYSDDARIAIKVTLSLIEAIQNDAVPNITNLF